MSKKHRKRKKIASHVAILQPVPQSIADTSSTPAPPERKSSFVSEINHSTLSELRSIILIVGFLLILTTVIVIVSWRTDYLDQLSAKIVEVLNIQ